MRPSTPGRIDAPGFLVSAADRKRAVERVDPRSGFPEPAFDVGSPAPAADVSSDVRSGENGVVPGSVYHHAGRRGRATGGGAETRLSSGDDVSPRPLRRERTVFRIDRTDGANASPCRLLVVPSSVVAFGLRARDGGTSPSGVRCRFQSSCKQMARKRASHRPTAPDRYPTGSTPGPPGGTAQAPPDPAPRSPEETHPATEPEYSHLDDAAIRPLEKHHPPHHVARFGNVRSHRPRREAERSTDLLPPGYTDAKHRT